MSTYREIRSLAQELNSPRIRQRRAAGEKLQQMLSMAEVRRRLAQEAGAAAAGRQGNEGRDRRSINVERRMALSEMWRYIILNAVLSVQAIAQGSSKMTETDILMPYKLIKCCDLPYENPEMAIDEPSKLSRKETKLVFTYCYDMLQNEAALDLAEVQLLEMLAYLCGRKEYVAYMRPHLEMHAVVQEIEHRLIPKSDKNSVQPDVGLVCAKIFENLISTSSHLGIGLHLLMAGCVKFVATWCVNMSNRERQGPTAELPHLFRGLAILIKSDVEQAIVPLTRHGRPILSFCKRCYVNADVAHRAALDEYFLSHL